MNTNQRRENGFSLTEILIVLVILGFGLGTTAFFSRTITQNNLFSRQHDDAVHLSWSRLEQLRYFRDQATYDAIQSGSGSSVGANATFTLTWTVTPNTVPPYKVIKMQTSWVDARSITRSVTLDSLVAWSDPLSIAGIM